MRRVLLLLTLLALLGLPSLAPPATAADTTITLTHQGRTITVRLTPFVLRAPSFQVLLQQANGTLVPQTVQAERSFVGTVDGDTGAVASAIRASDGTLRGQVTFDRGGTWYFDGTAVSDRGLTPPSAYHYPNAESASRNVTVGPGQAGATTYRWDIAYDVDTSWFVNAGSSVAKTLDVVELSTVSLVNSYLTNAKLRPAVGRVVIRGSAAVSPYTSQIGPSGSPLGTTRTEWMTKQGTMTWDDVALLYVAQEGGPTGGVAFLNTVTGDYGVSANEGAGAQRPILRHELGHTWGAGDNHTNGPEGATINSGNQFDRFDGTELSAFFRRRDSVLDKLTEVPATTQQLPPYAALDLVPASRSGFPVTIDVAANDLDANNNAIAARFVQTTTALGGKASLVGGKVVYTPPLVGAPTTDVFGYLLYDSTGRTASGVVIAKVTPVPVLTAPTVGVQAQRIAVTGRTKANVPVDLYARLRGQAAFTRLATNLSTASGAYAFTYTVRDDTVFLTRAAGAQSAPAVLKLRPTVDGPYTVTIRKGQPVVFYGSGAPRTTVVLNIHRPGTPALDYSGRRTAVVGPGGRWAITFVPTTDERFFVRSPNGLITPGNQVLLR